MKAVFEQSSQFILFLCFFLVEFVHFEEQDAGRCKSQFSFAIVVGVGFDSSHFVLPFGFLHLPEEEAHIVGGTTFGILAGCSSLHLPFLPVQFLPQIFAFCQLIVSSFFIFLLINVVISVFFGDGGGSGEGVIEGFGVGEGVVAEFVDAVVEIRHHFAYPVS